MTGIKKLTNGMFTFSVTPPEHTPHSMDQSKNPSNHQGNNDTALDTSTPAAPNTQITSSSRKANRRRVLLLRIFLWVSIIAIFLGYMTYELPEQDMDSDELITSYIIRKNIPDLVENRVTRGHPPFYFRFFERICG